MLTVFLVMYALHCTWVTSEAYSSPSIVLSAKSYDGSLIIFDDFREAYYWLRMNTAPVSLFKQFKNVGEYQLLYFFKNLGCKNYVLVGLRLSASRHG